MSFRLFLLALAILDCSAPAYAGSVADFTLSAALQSGTAQGAITIDTADGQVTGGNFTVYVPANSGFPAFTDTFTTLQNAGYNGTNQIADFVYGTDIFELSLPLTSLVGYTGSPVCSTTERSGCTIAGSQGYYPTILVYFDQQLGDAAVTGSLTPSSVPEPSTFLLIGLGLAVAFTARESLNSTLCVPKA
jgi:hypothetical protein